MHARWPCSGSLFTEAHVRVIFEKRSVVSRSGDPLEVVSVSVPPPGRCDVWGPFRVCRRHDPMRHSCVPRRFRAARPSDGDDRHGPTSEFRPRDHRHCDTRRNRVERGSFQEGRPPGRDRHAGLRTRRNLAASRNLLMKRGQRIVVCAHVTIERKAFAVFVNARPVLRRRSTKSKSAMVLRIVAPARLAAGRPGGGR